MKPNWLLTHGRGLINKDIIKFLPNKNTDAENDDFTSYNHTKIRSDLIFQTGTIELSIQLKNKEDKVQLLLGSDHNMINIGLNTDKYAYGISEMISGQYQQLNMQGFGINPPIKEWLRVKIIYIGSILELYINDVRVCKTNVTIHNSQVEIVYKGREEVQLKDIVFSPINPKAFIIMQFSDEFNSLYKEVISPLCEKFGYEVIRADDMYTTGLVINDITQAIKESSLIIADITPNNPNVYYEVGYAHGIHKPTILLSDKNREKLPFDISGFRLLFYQNTIAGKPKIESALEKHLQAIKNT